MEEFKQAETEREKFLRIFGNVDFDNPEEAQEEIDYLQEQINLKKEKLETPEYVGDEHETYGLNAEIKRLSEGLSDLQKKFKEFRGE